MEELSQDLIFHNNFSLNIKSFTKQNSKLRIQSKLDRNQSRLTVCRSQPTQPAAHSRFCFQFSRKLDSRETTKVKEFFDCGVLKFVYQILIRNQNLNIDFVQTADFLVP